LAQGSIGLPSSEKNGGALRSVFIAGRLHKAGEPFPIGQGIHLQLRLTTTEP
jgi:hypothetical protein